MPKKIRFAPSLTALLLGVSALSTTAQAGWFDFGSKPQATATKDDKAAAPAANPATDLEDSIHQAQLLRLSGNYSEALNHLSQLMLVAADDARVVSEYGKTLASMGRAEEAVNFLTRAQQLQPGDWTVYSAMGVAYDEIGNQKQAQVNYEKALALRPDEPSVLSNYALSRMLAKDPAMARQLADRAEAANAVVKDEKIARDIAMIRSMAPEARDNLAANMPAPAPRAAAAAPPLAAPHVAVAAAPLTPVAHFQRTQAAIAPTRVAASAPRALAANSMIQAQPQMAPLLNQAPRGVVMQPVPVDPLAGPVARKPATHGPRSLQPRTEPKPEAVHEMPARPPVKTEAPKLAAETAKPVSAAESLEARAEAIAKTLNKPGAIAQAKAEAGKDAPVPAQAAKVSLAVKAADVKPAAAHAAPKVLAPVKTANAKPEPAKAKPAAKDTIPGLRLSANAY